MFVITLEQICPAVNWHMRLMPGMWSANRVHKVLIVRGLGELNHSSKQFVNTYPRNGLSGLARVLSTCACLVLNATTLLNP